MLDTKTNTDSKPKAGRDPEAGGGSRFGRSRDSDQHPTTGQPSNEHGLRAADPANRTRRDVAPAGTVFGIMLATLLLAAGLNAETMLHQAEASELGRSRDVAMAFWRPVERTGSLIGLNLPRGGLEAVRNADQTGNPAAKTVAGPAKNGPTPGNGDQEQVLGPITTDADIDGDQPPSPTTGSEPAPTTSQAPSPPTSIETGTAPDPPSPEGEVDLDPAADQVDPLGPPEPGFALRRPTAEDPLRILIVGDSTLDAVGTSVLRDLAQTGVTDGVLDYRVSSGLSRPDFFDWPGHLRQLRPQLDTELVVVMVGANDAQPFIIDGVAESFGTERWFEIYRSRVRGLLDELTADGDWVVWIGQPAMRRDDFDAKMQQLNQLYVEELAAYPTAIFVDSRPVMGDTDGNYTAHLVDAEGNRTQVRKTDGIHLTSAGGDHLAPVVVAAINEIAPLY
jgi:hypothetical protein